jgi:hypothetical protein
VKKHDEGMRLCYSKDLQTQANAILTIMIWFYYSPLNSRAF